MTFEEALHRKIHKIRLPWMDTGFFVDPRVTEPGSKHNITWADLFKYGKPETGFDGKPLVRKVIVCEEENRWEPAE